MSILFLSDLTGDLLERAIMSERPFHVPHALQTGEVLQAFYRFGPWTEVELSGESKRDLAPAAGRSSTRQPPLIMLPGLGATMVCWWVRGGPVLKGWGE